MTAKIQNHCTAQSDTFSPRSTTINSGTLLKSKDRCVLIKDSVGIMARLAEHFTDLFDNPLATDESVINGLP